MVMVEELSVDVMRLPSPLHVDARPKQMTSIFAVRCGSYGTCDVCHRFVEVHTMHFQVEKCWQERICRGTIAIEPGSDDFVFVFLRTLDLDVLSFRALVYLHLRGLVSLIVCRFISLSASVFMSVWMSSFVSQDFYLSLSGCRTLMKPLSMSISTSINVHILIFIVLLSPLCFSMLRFVSRLVSLYTFDVLVGVCLSFLFVRVLFIQSLVIRSLSLPTSFFLFVSTSLPPSLPPQLSPFPHFYWFVLRLNIALLCSAYSSKYHVFFFFDIDIFIHVCVNVCVDANVNDFFFVHEFVFSVVSLSLALSVCVMRRLSVRVSSRPIPSLPILFSCPLCLPLSWFILSVVFSQDHYLHVVPYLRALFVSGALVVCSVVLSMFSMFFGLFNGDVCSIA